MAGLVGAIALFPVYSAAFLGDITLFHVLLFAGENFVCANANEHNATSAINKVDFFIVSVF